MTQEQIKAAIQRNGTDRLFEIGFKARQSLKGLFIRTKDYEELNRKNLWRIVSESYIAEYYRTKNEDLARIFNGTDFIRMEAQAGASK